MQLEAELRWLDEFDGVLASLPEPGPPAAEGAGGRSRALVSDPRPNPGRPRAGPGHQEAEGDMTREREAATEVIIAGGGPTGLMLACELALAGVRAVVLERQLERPGFCRGFNLNAQPGVAGPSGPRRAVPRRGLAQCPSRASPGWTPP